MPHYTLMSIHHSTSPTTLTGLNVSCSLQSFFVRSPMLSLRLGTDSQNTRSAFSLMFFKSAFSMKAFDTFEFLDIIRSYRHSYNKNIALLHILFLIYIILVSHNNPDSITCKLRIQPPPKRSPYITCCCCCLNEGFSLLRLDSCGQKPSLLHATRNLIYAPIYFIH